jgi:uncharacterized membrane protein SpoIIM required for sporulation
MPWPRAGANPRPPTTWPTSGRSPLTTASKLTELVARLQKHAPTTEEARAFPELYRLAVQELAEARARHRPVSEQLQTGIRQAHALLYVPEAQPVGASLTGLARAFPPAVRAAWRPILLAYALLAAGTLWGYGEIRRSPSSAEILLPNGILQNADRFEDADEDRFGDPANAGFYFTNNTRAALTAYAFGATFGIGTALVLIFNGVILGGTAAIVSQTRSLSALLSWLLPHGGVELTAIAIAAAAGFQIGGAMLRPGPLRRRDALAEAARRSLPLALGTAFLLVVAGLTEASLGPATWPLWIKALIGLTLDALMLAWFLTGGRVAPDDRA